MKKARMDDATFDLNLAPMLDIIVSIIPMLLLSVVFVEITVIETPVPQAVERAMAAADENKNEVQISLGVSKNEGFKLTVLEDGKSNETTIGLQGTEFDYKGLHKQLVDVKLKHPNIFRLELNPEEGVKLQVITKVMDSVRKKSKTDPQIFFTDKETGKQVETDLMFPDIVFGNVAGG